MRKKEGNKRQDIFHAAIQVFAAEGFHKAKITKIAELAGVASGSVYLYFKNKENLIQTIIAETWGALSSTFQKTVNRQDLNPLEKLDAMIDLVFDMFTDNPELAIVFANEQHHLLQKGDAGFSIYLDHFLDLGEAVVAQGIEAGLFNPHLHVNVFRHFVLGGIHQLLTVWASQTENFTLNQIRQEIKVILKRGIEK